MVIFRLSREVVNVCDGPWRYQLFKYKYNNNNNMPKAAKTDAEWRASMIAFARSGKATFGSGEHPRCKKWKRVMDCILKCPKHTKAVSVSAFFKSKGPSAPTKVITCNCTYHDAPLPVKEAKKAPTSPKTPSKQIVPGASLTPPVKAKQIYNNGHELPKPPEMMKVGDMRDKSGWKRSKNRLDLYYFGPTNGRCPATLWKRQR